MSSWRPVTSQNLAKSLLLPAVLGAVGLEGGDGRVLESERPRDLAGRGVLGDGVLEDGDLAVEHRDVDKLALAGLFALIEGGQRAVGAHHAGDDVADRGADAHGVSVRLAGDAHDAAHRLDDHIVGGPAGIGAGLAEAGDRNIHAAGIDLLDVLIAEAHLVERAGLEVLNEHVHVLDQVGQHLFALGGLGVDFEALLAAVDAQKVDALPFHIGAVGAGVVARTGHLAVDDLGAEVAQHHAAIGAREDLGHIQHLDAAQWFGCHSVIPPVSYNVYNLPRPAAVCRAGPMRKPAPPAVFETKSITCCNNSISCAILTAINPWESCGFFPKCRASVPSTPQGHEKGAERSLPPPAGRFCMVKKEILSFRCDRGRFQEEIRFVGYLHYSG